MNREQRYIGYIFLMIGVLIPLLFLLGGCAAFKPTIYDIKACPVGSSVCTTVRTESWREFTQPEVVYEKTQADGTSVRFLFNASEANTRTSPIESAVADVIRATPSVILPAPEG